MDVPLIVFISVFFGGGFLAIVMTTAIKLGTDFRRQSLATKFIQAMVEKGYSADEIERMVGISRGLDPAKAKKKFKDKANKPMPPVKNY